MKLDLAKDRVESCDFQRIVGGNSDVVLAAALACIRLKSSSS